MTSSRREFLAGAAAISAAACGGSRGDRGAAPAASVFISHGAPTLAIDPVKGVEFARLGRALGAPRALLVISAHWEASPPTIGTTVTRPVIHVYGGFAPELRTVEYAAPGSAAIATRVTSLLAPDVVRAENRGWDHGVWVPLVHMFPNADVPVLQLSLPSDSSRGGSSRSGGDYASCATRTSSSSRAAG